MSGSHSPETQRENFIQNKSDKSIHFEFPFCLIFTILIAASAFAQESVLFRFSLGGGNHPYAGVTLDSSGNIYGTTSAGGDFNGNYGTVY